MLAVGLFPVVALGQTTGAIEGRVTLASGGAPAHGATVLVVGVGRAVVTDSEGQFVIAGLPPGVYDVVAQREQMSAGFQSVTVTADQVSTVDFAIVAVAFRDEVTVTANAGGVATAFEAFNATSTVDAFEIASNPVGTIGEALANEPGVAIRSFGPGNSRPIIRGFDGDRVLVMQDGVRTGDLSSQSGDHGVTIDPNGLERIEIVRGPATLLYGSNAVGGVVNAITPAEGFRDSPFSGTRGRFSFDAGNANDQAGTSASMQHAEGDILFWAGGGTRRTDDYSTPLGPVENSATRLSNGQAGVGFFGDRFFASGGFTVDDGRYGVPFASEFHGHHEEEEDHEGEEHEDEGHHEDELMVDIATDRRVGRFDFGMRDLGARMLDSFRVVLNVIDYQHNELEIENGIESIGTAFNNRSYVLRADFTQPQTSRLSGRFGIWSQLRDYSAAGAEALAPDTTQSAFAAFAHEELSLGRYALQFGGRVERNDYSVAARPESDHDHEEEEGEHHDEEGEEHEDEDHLEPSDVRDRNFTGASASVGFRADLGRGSAFVANVTHSHRAPALEELYNFGPHVGNLAFEIGNPELEAEATTGLDVSFRHRSENVRATFNAYVYDISNFVFLDFEDEFVDNLRVADSLQGDSRFVGFDAEGSVRLGGSVWVELGLGMVNATLTETDEPLPRIPPLRGRFSLNIPYGGLTVTPEMVFAAEQSDAFRGETTTAGYTLVNLRATYTWNSQHLAHTVSFTGYNLTDELYRNHTSFIKDLAPEIGRGAKVGYSLRFF